MPRAKWEPDPKMKRRFQATRRLIQRRDQTQQAIDQAFAQYVNEDVPFVALQKEFGMDRQTIARHVNAARAATTTEEK